MKQALVICILALLSVNLCGQGVNQRDAAGRKQGYWEAVDSRGMPVYKGQFKDDKPVGEMTRYFPTGELRAKIFYENDGVTSRVTFYAQSGKIAAQGKYNGTKRDSTWTFYSMNSDNATSRVEYLDGKRHGTEQKYYPNGKIAEELVWKHDIRNGVWKQFFDNGQLKISATYLVGDLDGIYMTYYSNSMPEVKGVFRNGIPVGEWQRFDENGKPVVIKYENGQIANMAELEDSDLAFFNTMFDETKQLPEPTIEEFMRQ